jgi:hypothetical protein
MSVFIHALMRPTAIISDHEKKNGVFFFDMAHDKEHSNKMKGNIIQT